MLVGIKNISSKNFGLTTEPSLEHIEAILLTLECMNVISLRKPSYFLRIYCSSDKGGKLSNGDNMLESVEFDYLLSELQIIGAMTLYGADYFEVERNGEIYRRGGLINGEIVYDKGDE
jgi:hypothetical protein